MKKALLALLAIGWLAGCTATFKPSADIPRGVDAYKTIPAPSAASAAGKGFVDYRIGALDELNVQVFQEPDLTIEKVKVDASGNIDFPLIGKVRADGRTTTELAADIAHSLERYLVEPQVSVFVTSSVSQRVTVEGSVKDPGVFELQGPSSLLQALAMAKGPNERANTRDVVVFREIEGKRYAAVFNVDAIRAGYADDPLILGNDTVVVGQSGRRSFMQDFITLAPLTTSVFYQLINL